METNLEHEDLLIKLRGKLNEEKIKLWQAPYIGDDDNVTDTLQELADKYAASLSLDRAIVLNGLLELQQHSIERSKANEEFKETGFATFRVKVTHTGQKPKTLNIQKKLDVMGSDLIDTVAGEVGVDGSRVKLIYNGKVIKPTSSLDEQGLKNGVQLMALVMAESQEQVMREDKLYREMKTTLDDATLLSEHVDSDFGYDEYMKLEDQSGKAVELPAAERRSLVVGLALHERGRSAAKQQDHSLALLLFLEADRQLSECSSSILSKVDNWAVLQLDIAWCYLCLRSLPAAADAAARLARAETAFRASYGEDHERLIALKGTAANERVLLMRLYLLQGIVAYHQNRRGDARRLLEKAESELNSLKVDETAVTALIELGWTRAQARTGLRAAGGDLDRAHHYLADRRLERERARERHRRDRQQRMLGTCADGSPVSAQLVEALEGMGYSRALAVAALRNSNNNVADGVRLIQEQPELLIESEEDEPDDTPNSPGSPGSGGSPGSPGSAGSPTSANSAELPAEVDGMLLTQLQAMGYAAEDARAALRYARNNLPGAVDLLAAAMDGLQQPAEPGRPSTSRGGARRKLKKYMAKKFAKERAREQALQRLASGIAGDEDEHLDTSLLEEEHFLAQYKSLL